MPRIEIIPEGWETSDAKRRGDGSPTVDLCYSCAKGLEENEVIPADLLNELNENSGQEFGENDILGSTEVAHPPYDEDDPIDCDACGDELTADDN